MNADDIEVLRKAVRNHSVEYLADDGRFYAVRDVRWNVAHRYDVAILLDGTRVSLADEGLGSFRVSSLRPRKEPA